MSKYSVHQQPLGCIITWRNPDLKLKTITNNYN